MAVIYGHQHLNVSDVGAHTRFFVDTLGGVVVGTPGGSDTAVAFPNALIVLRDRPPTGGTKGTTVNHFAFGVPDIRRMVDRVKAHGWPMVTRAETAPAQEVRDDLAFMADQQTDIAFTMAPDETKIEFIEIRQQGVPIRVHHIHFLTPQVQEMRAWYVKLLDAKPGRRGDFEAADLPGVNLTYSLSPVPVTGTRGRALDHVGFEVTDLDRVCRRLAAAGIETDGPITRTSRTVASVFVTDPWGTSVELTEGLAGQPPED